MLCYGKSVVLRRRKGAGLFLSHQRGAEIDLLLVWPDGSRWAVEIRRSLSPKPERGFHAACADLAPARKYVVYPGKERYRIASDIEVIPLVELASLVQVGS